MMPTNKLGRNADAIELYKEAIQAYPQRIEAYDGILTIALANKVRDDNNDFISIQNQWPHV